MRTVLIIDDSAFSRSTIKRILQKYGFNVIGEAENGKDGVKKYKELQPDIVSLDMVMADMSGIEVLKQIREHDPNAYVMMVSSMGQRPMIDEATSLGAKDFFVKPFDEQRVKEVIAKL